MKKKHTFTNHDDLKAHLKSMKVEMKQTQENMRLNAETYIAEIPGYIFNSIFNLKNKHDSMVSNPIGKTMARAINSSILKKENFVMKLLSNLLFKQVGKKVEHKLLDLNK